LIIEINTQSPSPIYEQIRDQIVLGMAAKKFIPGEALPSVRNLAADLGVNFHTVNKAYSMLCEEVTEELRKTYKKQGKAI